MSWLFMIIGDHVKVVHNNYHRGIILIAITTLK